MTLEQALAAGKQPSGWSFALHGPLLGKDEDYSAWRDPEGRTGIDWHYPMQIEDSICPMLITYSLPGCFLYESSGWRPVPKAEKEKDR